MASKDSKTKPKRAYTSVSRVGRLEKARHLAHVKAEKGYKPSKSDFTTLQKLVKRNNSQREYRLNSLMKSTGLSENELVRMGAVNAKITGGARSYLKYIKSDYDMANLLDTLNNQVKVKRKGSRADVYLSRLEKKSGKKYPRIFSDQLPRSQGEQVKHTFRRLLDEGSRMSIEARDFVEANMEFEDIIKFEHQNMSLVNKLYTKYGSHEISLEVGNISQRFEKAVMKYIKQTKGLTFTE